MVPMREVHAAQAAQVVGSDKPAILRGLVCDWPAVRLALQSPEAVCTFIAGLDSGTEADALLTAAPERGRLFYNADMSGFNYARRKLPLTAVIEQLARYSQFDNPPAVAIQSARVDACLPGFEKNHPLPVLEGVSPRIWIGNHVVTPAHFDESHNVACVVAGQRRFTLFPPEQVDNLYIGPRDFAPTPTPISMVDFAEPDFARYPRFREALAAAQVAELGPGDAIYIPSLWWHHVRSIGILNILVNYWWLPEGSREQAETMYARLKPRAEWSLA